MVSSGSLRAPLQLCAVGASETGRVRPHNEDRFVIREDLQLFLVADGAGGHAAGDLAASVGTLSVVNFLEATAAEQAALPEVDRFGVPSAARWLGRALHKANRDVYEIASAEHAVKGMGSTLVAALFVRGTGQLVVAHVGDSRCYRSRAGHCEALTRDHSLIQDALEEHPELDERLLAKLPRNVVTRALGMAATTRVPVGAFAVAPGDRYLLCSDGLSSFVPGHLIAELLASPRPTGAVVQLLLNAADDAGAPDNVTVVIVESPDEDPDGERRREQLRAAEREAAAERARDPSEPELLLTGIEELDLVEAITALTHPGLGAVRPTELATAPRPGKKPSR